MTPSQLAAKNTGLVAAVARAIHPKLPRSVEFGDLIGYGNLGLMEAAKTFDPARGVKFATYASPRIRGAMLDGLREVDHLPRMYRQRLNRIEELNAEGLRTDAELRKATGLSEESFANTMSAKAGYHLASLSSTCRQKPGMDGRECSLAATLVASDPPPSSEAERDDWWSAMLRGFSRLERTMVILHFREGLMQSEVAAAVGLSPSRVSQCLAGILAVLRSNPNRGLAA